MSLRSSELFIYYFKQSAVLVTLIQTLWGSATKWEHIAPELAQGFDVCTWHMPMADLGFSVPATVRYRISNDIWWPHYGNWILITWLKIKLTTRNKCSFPQRYLCLFFVLSSHNLEYHLILPYEFVSIQTFP